MAKDYVERLRARLAPTIAALPAGVTVEIKHFFSGAAAYANHRICISLTGVGLAMKLPEDGRAAAGGRRPTPALFSQGTDQETVRHPARRGCR